jgi:two-component system sensor histidine kinase MprB
VSLRRRIAADAASAVAAVAVAVGVISYASTRSNLIGEIRSELRGRAAPLLESHGHQGGGTPGGRPQTSAGAQPAHGGGFNVPGPPAFGGAPGVFQVVEPDGRIARNGGLPVTSSVLSIARNGRGSVFYDAHVSGHHLEIYAAWDAPDRHVIQVALPLSGVDSVLDGVLLPDALLVGGGILLAGILGLAISRTALRPIERFVAQTEQVIGELEKPRRLEETGASELRRLAAGFNRTLDALERSIEAQRHLIADASHELRTPIAALRSNIQIFLDSARLPAHERTGLQQSILAELDELTQVVADVVELARGATPSERVERVELDTIVRDAIDRACRRAPGLRFDVDLEPTVVEGVSERIARAVSNVIDNGRKWSPPEETIGVRLHQGTLTVRDHGPGFAESDLPYVFDRFYRADAARRLPGSGLGLAIVKQAAESHRGFAEASNAADGGAVIRVSFGAPVADSAPAPTR